MAALGWEVRRAGTQLEEGEMEVVFLASPYGDLEGCGWWDPQAWACLLSDKVSQASPAGVVSEPVSLLSKPGSSFFWKLSSWKILEHYKATEYRKEKITTE